MKASRNYNVTLEKGTLTIGRQKVEVTITGNTDTVTYNGVEQSVKGYKVDIPEDSGLTIEDLSRNIPAGEIGGHPVTLHAKVVNDMKNAEAKGTNAGEYPMGLLTKQFVCDNLNYDVTFKVTDGNLTIEKADLTIKVNDITADYDGEEHGVEGKHYAGDEANALVTVTGLQGEDTLHSLDMVEFLRIAAGTYTDKLEINATAHGGGPDVKSKNGEAGDAAFPDEEGFSKMKASRNYNVTLEKGTLTINRAKVTVTANDASKVEGANDPTFTATVEGLVEGESADLISYTFEREPGQTPGTYAITPTGDAIQGNYEVEFVAGTLTITEAPAPAPTPGGGGGGGGAGGGGGGGAAAVAAAPAAPAAPAAAIDDNPTPTTINDNAAPKASTASWALINLICALLTALLSLIMLIRFFGKRREENEVTGEVTDVKSGGGVRLASIIPAIGGIVAFILTENMAAQMTMVDKWTVLMIVILAIQAGVGVLAKMRDNYELEDVE